jgi:hypothetical protein
MLRPGGVSARAFLAGHIEVLMATYVQVSARLLRDAAKFFRNVADQNEPLREQMVDNAVVYEQMADLLEANPLGEIDLGDAPENAPS